MLDDAARMLVLADELSENGDPRGELILVQFKLERDDDARLKRREEELLQRYAPPTHVSVTWRRGYWRSIAFHSELLVEPGFQPIVERTFADESARFATELKVGFLAWHKKQSDEVAMLLPRAAAAMGERTRRLELGWMIREGNTVQNDHHNLGTVDLSAFPNTEVLKIHAGLFSVGKRLGLPRLRSLCIETSWMLASTIDAVCAEPMPELGSMNLWFGDDYHSDILSSDGLGPILDGRATPALHDLGLMNLAFTDELCLALVNAPILPRLTSLDLSMGTMTADGAAAIAANRARFAHLGRLHLDENSLTPKDIETVRRALPKTRITASNQKDGRYVSVHE